jgi:hypothetical protein
MPPKLHKEMKLGKRKAKTGAKASSRRKWISDLYARAELDAKRNPPIDLLISLPPWRFLEPD